MCSKNVEAYNKLIVKQNFCASSWLITEISITCVSFSHIITYMARFYETFIKHKMCFWIFATVLSEIFIVYEAIRQILSKMYIGLHVKYSLLLYNFNKT